MTLKIRAVVAACVAGLTLLYAAPAYASASHPTKGERKFLALVHEEDLVSGGSDSSALNLGHIYCKDVGKRGIKHATAAFATAMRQTPEAGISDAEVAE